MADLQRIQNCIDKLSSLIQEVEAMPELADGEALKNKLLIWKSETDAVLSVECPNYTPEVDEFNRRWRISKIDNSTKNALLRKLSNARTDLRLIMQTQQPEQKTAVKPALPTYAITDYAKALFNI